MPLKNQVIPAVLQAGLDTGKDPKLVSQGLLILENCLMDKQGELSKRPGMLSLTGTITNENMATYKDRAMMVGATVQRHAGSTSTTGGFDSLGTAGGLDVDVDARAALSNTLVNCAEIQEASEIQAVAYEEYDNIALAYKWKLATYDRYSGVLIDEIEDDYQIRIIKLDDTIYYFKPSGAGAVLHYSKVDSDGTINASMQTITGCVATHTNLVGWCAFDLCEMDTRTYDLMLVHKNAAGTGLQVLTWDGPSFGAGTWRQTAITAPTTVAQVCCSRLLDGEGVVTYVDSGASPRAVTCEAFDVELASQVSAAEVFTDAGTSTFGNLTAVRMTDTLHRIYITLYTSTENADVIAWNNFIDTAGTGSAQYAKDSCPVWATGLIPAAKPYIASDAKHYMLLFRRGYSATDVNWGYLICDEDADIKARVLPGDTYSAAYHRGVGAYYERTTDTWIMGGIKRTDVNTSALVLMEVSLAPGQIHSVESPQHLLIGGSCPWEVDGQQVVEQGFPWYPFHVDTSRAAPGGATDIGEGDYGYKVVYEWYDARGHLHRSRPSPAATITTTTANDVVTLTVPNLHNTAKTDATIVIYRTAVDGSVYYRLKAVANGSDRTQDVTDSAGDSSITYNAYIYTTGGVVGNEAPPPYRVHCIHQHRHVVVHREAEAWDIRYSKEFVTSEGIAYSGFLGIKCDPAGGRITALASYSDRLLIFKENRIYATDGYGKTASATGQGYREPYLVSEAVGCVNQKTLVETPAGLLFEGEDGIYSLDKTMRVQAIGAPASYHFDQISLVSAALVSEQHYAIFVSSDGVALVFDYMHGQWMEFTNHQGSDCTVAQGILYHRTSSDVVKAENRASYLDDSSQVEMRIRTGWFSFAGLLGFKRIREILLIGQNVSNHILRVKVAYDFDPIWVDSQTFEASDLGTYLDASSHYDVNVAAACTAPDYLDKSYLLSVGTSRQKCTSIMLELTDECPTGVTVAAGFTMNGISFLAAVKTGAKRLGTGRYL